MKNHKLTALTVVLAATLMPSAMTQAADKDSMGKDPMTQELSGMNGADFEAAYLAMMIQHHQEGVKMAEMVPGKGKSDKLKQMAKKIASDQQGEIGQMTGWLKQWHNKTPDAHKMPAASMKMMKDQMNELNAAQGDEFDTKWAKMMAMHHEGAIGMAQLAVDKAEHKEVKEMAKKIVRAQKEERQELMKMSSGTSAKSAQYTCSMHPEVVQSTEGKCPKCGMTLVRKT